MARFRRDFICRLIALLGLAWVAPGENGWVAVYPESTEKQDFREMESLASALSAALPGAVLGVLVSVPLSVTLSVFLSVIRETSGEAGRSSKRSSG